MRPMILLLLSTGLWGCGRREPPAPKPVAAPLSPVPAPPSAGAIPAGRLPRTFRSAAATPGASETPQYWPSFRFRTMDHRPAILVMNGEDYAELPGLWTITRSTVFDPKIPVPVWPPPGARPCGAVAGLESDFHAPNTLRLFLSQPSSELVKRYPHLEEGDHVLFVKALDCQGALRMRVEGRDHRLYRWTEYLPIGDEGTQEALRRTLWFEAAE